jgi:hypothetical protein
MTENYGSGKSQISFHPERIRAAFDYDLEGGQGFRLIPDSEVAIQLKKEQRLLAGNNERIFTFSEEFVRNWADKTYHFLAPEDRAAITQRLMKELLDA